MTEKHAQALATVLGGKVIEPTPTERPHAVALTRADGRYALIDLDAGAVYHDEHACWTGYLTSGSDPRGRVDAEHWGAWTDSREWAQALATVLGEFAQFKHVGGNIFLVYYERPDGRFAIVGGESGCVFPSLRDFLLDPNAETAEHFDFV